MNSKNYFMSHITKFHRDNIITSLHQTGKSRASMKHQDEKKRKQLDLF